MNASGDAPVPRKRVSLRLGPGLLRGPVAAPPSKSLLHRALVGAALAGDVSRVPVPAAPSDDIAATLRVLRALVPSAFGVSRAAPPDAPAACDCGESGTTLRLALPVAAALGVDALFTGSGRLPLRPMAPYVDAFAGSGAVLERLREGGAWLPLRVSGRLRPGVYRLPGDVSSQFVSGLLFALPLLDGPSRIEISGALQSRPYVEMTLATMRAFGVAASESGGGFDVPGGQRYRPDADPPVESDASQEAFWHLARFLGSDVSIAAPAASGLQGDAAFPALLARLASAAPGAPAPEIDVSQVPDLVPALAVAAAFSPAGARLVHAERLRLKESDRLATTCALLRAIGCAASETADGLAVPPGPPPPPRAGAPAPAVDGAGDHRIVMAAAMAATRAPLVVRGAEAVNKSYPSFFEEYRACGGYAEDAENPTGQEA